VLAGVLGEVNRDDEDDPAASLKNLKNAVAELYLTIKQKTRDEVRKTVSAMN